MQAKTLPVRDVASPGDMQRAASAEAALGVNRSECSGNSQVWRTLAGQTNADLFSVWRPEAFCCVQLLPEGASLLQELAHPGGRPVKHNKTSKSQRTIHDSQLRHDLQQLWAPLFVN